MAAKKEAKAKKETKAVVESSSDNMHIIEMRIENIKRVKLVHLKPKNNLVIVGGKNGQGKSSVLDAVTWALTGTSTLPRYPIRKGQRTGSIQITIGEYLVTRHFTVIDEDKSAKGNTYTTKLVITGKRGETFGSPQELLDGLLGKIGFDPMYFMRLKDKAQLEELRALVQFDIDIDELDKTQDDDYTARTKAGQLVDSLKHRISAMAVPAPDLPVDAIDVAAITQKLQNAANYNSVVAAQKQNEHSKRERAQLCVEVSDSIGREIDRMQAKILELGEQASNQLDQRDKLLEEADAIVIGDEIDTAEVAAALTRANETNTAIQRAQNYRQMEKDLDEADLAWAAIDKRMKDRAREREAAIARAKMPIEKLSIKNGEVVYDGLPLEQASTAEKIRVSMAIGMAANPNLRVLRISDGSLLDDDNLQLVGELARANKFQVLIERVQTGDEPGEEVTVVMEDGNASGDDVAVAK